MYEYIIKILTYDSLFSGHLDSMRSGSSIDTSTRHAWITRAKKSQTNLSASISTEKADTFCVNDSYRDNWNFRACNWKSAAPSYHSTKI